MILNITFMFSSCEFTITLSSSGVRKSLPVFARVIAVRNTRNEPHWRMTIFICFQPVAVFGCDSTTILRELSYEITIHHLVQRMFNAITFIYPSLYKSHKHNPLVSTTSSCSAQLNRNKIKLTSFVQLQHS